MLLSESNFLIIKLHAIDTNVCGYHWKKISPHCNMQSHRIYLIHVFPKQCIMSFCIVFYPNLKLNIENPWNTFLKKSLKLGQFCGCFYGVDVITQNITSVRFDIRGETFHKTLYGCIYSEYKCLSGSSISECSSRSVSGSRRGMLLSCIHQWSQRTLTLWSPALYTVTLCYKTLWYKTILLIRRLDIRLFCIYMNEWIFIDLNLIQYLAKIHYKQN